ncbi:MAG: hypothetical protein EZS28_016411 [Streblomastix strix]|uniref:Uncharacterized protein n=1 Tax=Streblomastix strix TaxID=222440 RepID=A0A5J4VZR8_9EUKA|nr:MAG: hypothetical protein EZS28_016411 [Streblomastix strix]
MERPVLKLRVSEYNILFAYNITGAVKIDTNIGTGVSNQELPSYGLNEIDLYIEILGRSIYGVAETSTYPERSNILSKADIKSAQSNLELEMECILKTLFNFFLLSNRAGVVVQHLLGTAVLEKQLIESNLFLEQIQTPQIAIDDKEPNQLSVSFPTTSSNDSDKNLKLIYLDNSNTIVVFNTQTDAMKSDYTRTGKRISTESGPF